MKDVVFDRQSYVNQLINSMHNHMIKVVTGIRRCGKSYLLFELFRNYLLAHGTQSDHIICIDLENRRNQSLRDPDALLDYIDQHMRDESMYYILLDEVQLVPEFEDVLNSYLKIKNADVYVTGSNARFLSKDVITEFRGRGDEIHIMPLSFSEYYAAFPNQDWWEVWQQYALYGGLPQAVCESDDMKRSSYLKSLFKKTYLKDIIERNHVQNDMALEQLLNMISSSIGSLTNPTKLANSFASNGIKGISDVTIKQYLDYLEDAFIIHRAARYDVRGKRYLQSPQKYYFTDMGLRNARMNFRQFEPTHAMENIIFNELLVRGYDIDVGMIEVNERQEDGNYKRKQIEIDFVANRGVQRIYIQSAYAMDTDEKRQQELRPLQHTDDSFRKIVIVREERLKSITDDGIITMGLKQFLCDEHSLD